MQKCLFCILKLISCALRIFSLSDLCRAHCFSWLCRDRRHVCRAAQHVFHNLRRIWTACWHCSLACHDDGPLHMLVLLCVLMPFIVSSMLTALLSSLVSCWNELEKKLMLVELTHYGLSQLIIINPLIA